MYRIAVFVSGGGTNLQAIIDRIADGRLPNIKIVCVVASRTGTGAEERARKANIPVEIVVRKDYKSMAAYDAALIDVLDRYNPELIVLAGFLQLLGTGVVDRYKWRIINIHPSLIPSFSGKGVFGIRPHEAVLDYGCKVTGATVHFVDQAYDEGPILLQKAIPVLPDDTPQSLQQRVMTHCEQEILPQAILLLSQGQVVIQGRRTYLRAAQAHEGALAAADPECESFPKPAAVRPENA